MKKIIFVCFVLLTASLNVFAQAKYVDQRGTLTDTSSMLSPYLKKTSIVGTANYVPLFTGTNSLGNSVMYQNLSKIGIGTISPNTKLEISSGTAGSSGLRFTNLTNTTAGTSIFSGILGLNSTGDVGIASLTGSSISGLSNGQVTYGGTTGNLAQSSSFFWDQTNNRLGIGTSIPSTNLHVSSLVATNTVNADAQVLRLSRPTNSGVKWDNIAQFNLGSYSTGGVANTRMDLAMNDGGSTTTSNIMTWQANGYVGISTTTPAYNLDVLGSARIQSVPNTTVATGVLVKHPTTGQISEQLISDIKNTAWYTTGTTTDAGGDKTTAIHRTGSATIDNGYLQAISSSTTNAFTMDPTDVVGPKLKMGTSSNFGTYLEIGAYNNQNNLDTKNRDFALFSTSITSGLQFKNATGRIGIGTTSPSQRLHINGQVEIDTLRSGAATDSLVTSNSDGLLRRLSFSNATKNFAVVSATASGIVNNTAAQELGGVDKKINGVDIGKGGGNFSSNTRVGFSALANNTTGVNSVGIGFQTLFNQTTGSNNVGMGTQALAFLSTGGNNVGIGTYSLKNQTTSSNNTALGYNSGVNITTGGQNVAIGVEALSDNLTSANNVAVGAYSLDLTTGGNNTALGYNSGKNNTSGAGNTILGYRAGENVSTGSNNVLVGSSGGFNITTGSGNISMGNSNLVSGSNNTIIGGTTSSLNIGASNKSNIVALGNGAGSVRVYADSLGLVGINTISPSNRLTVYEPSSAAVLGLYYPAANGPVAQTTTGQINLGTSNSWFTTIRSVIPAAKNQDQQNLEFTTGNASNDNTQVSRMTIQSQTGNVGVNKQTPLNKLVVQGSNNAVSPLGTDQTNATFRIDGPTNHSLDMGTLVGSPFGAYIQSHNKAATTTLPLVLNSAGGNVGIGTTAPGSTLEVNGASTNTTAFNAAAATTIDFSKSNLAYTTASAGAFTITNMKDGGTYTLAVQGATSGTASFTASGFTIKSINNGATTAGKHTLYTFLVMGTNVYYYMATGF
ncbi:beta strand repeat-containing protein [Aquirufa sp. ROCK2-A2]